MKYIYIYLVLICIILFFAYKNSQIIEIKESFHPYIRQWYRPVIRNTRLYTNKWYQNINERLNRFWRKIGWLK